MIIPFLRRGAYKARRLEQGRVYLRMPKVGDWLDWSSLREASRDFLAPWEPLWPHDALTRASFRRRVEHVRQEWEQGTGYGFLIYLKENNRMVGGITLSNVRRGVSQTASLGYWVGQPVARQGYMTEALQVAIDFAFGELGLHRLEAACLPANAASRRLLEKSGFSEIGYARQYLRIAGKWQDHILYERLKSDI